MEAKKQRNIWIPAEAISNNIDLLTEILLRLQAKPLIKFKCVSKQWLSLISNPQFCLSHTHHHHSPYPTPTSLLLYKNPCPEFEMVPLKHDQTVFKVPSLDFLNTPCVEIMQSCNGLLLCSSIMYNYYLCNPITKQFKRLVVPSCNESILEWVCLAFDPLKSKHYKFICFRLRKDGTNKHQIDLYSSETDSWSLVKISYGYLDFSFAVFCNGAVHWHSEVSGCIFYFDVDRECLKTMSMPKLAKCWYHYNVQYFGESRGHLHLIVTESRYPSKFDVWEMAPDYSGWFVRYHVNLDAQRSAFPWYYGDFKVLHVIRAQKEEDSIVVIYVGDTAISYNVHDGTSKKLCDFDNSQVDYGYTWRDSLLYIETLTSV